MNSFKKPDFVERRDAAAHAKKAALQKFRKSAADPAFAERQTARIANARAAKNVREIEKAEKVRDAERAQQAERDAAIWAEQAAAESANREVTLQAERKAGRDARYAARKSRSKR
jgi:Family of unknown function (DUF6481)